MSIGKLIKNANSPFFSFEFYPPAEKSDQLEKFYTTADELAALKPLFVSVTYGAGGKKQQNTLNITAELAKRSLEVMAHLTCVGANRRKLSNFIDELKANGIHNILALRGDAPENENWNWEEGEFHHASDLVSFIKKDYPDISIGVAAYPSPHPESPSIEIDRKHTADKFSAGAEFAITQLFFDVREYIDLVQNLRKKNIDIPVIPGILPIQSFESLKRVLSLCGANIPGKLYLSLEEANEKKGTDAVREAGIAFALEMIRRLIEFGAPGIHIYTLNNSQLARRLVNESGLSNQ